ncbi:hypothetical protein BST44_20395 [Mycobacterium scrofulaceum]|uniref:Uncharacterized protein n=1 Tax=Mycobacterium scrofulaceum TaxID=1783 RepID=A0A1X0KAR4_MYCSC|nr:hypothetical protein BST44_20395 [Mycobacterium scrofulaceum]
MRICLTSPSRRRCSRDPRSMVTARFARLRRPRDRHRPIVTTRFARLRRPRDRHGPARRPAPPARRHWRP